MIRQAVAYVLSWSMFWTGYAIAEVAFHSDRTARYLSWLYRPYNYLMSRSSIVQDWAGIENGPWKRVGEP